MSSTDPAQPLAAAQQALSNGTGNGISDSLDEGGKGQKHRQGDGDDLGNRDAEVPTAETATAAEPADTADTAKQHHHHDTLAALLGSGSESASASPSANAGGRTDTQHPYGTTRDDLQARRDTEHWRQRGRASLELERAVAAQLGVPDKEHKRSSFSIAMGNAFDNIGAAVRQPDPPSAYAYNKSAPAQGTATASSPSQAPPPTSNTGSPPVPYAGGIPPSPYSSPAAYGTPPQQPYQLGISPGGGYASPSSASSTPTGTPGVRAKKRRLPVPPRPRPDSSEDWLIPGNTDTKPDTNTDTKPGSNPDTKSLTSSTTETNGKREPSPPPAKEALPPSPATKPLLNVNVASLDDDTTVFFIDDNMLLPYEEEEEPRTPIPVLPDPDAPDALEDTPMERDVSPDPDSRAARGASFSAVGHSGTALSPVARFFTPEPGPGTDDTHSHGHDHSAGHTRSRASSSSSSSSLFEDLGAPAPETPMGGPVVDAAHAPTTATSLAASADGSTFRPSSFGPGTLGSNGVPPSVDERANGDESGDKHIGSLGAVGGAAALAALKTAPETRMGGEKADWNSSMTAIHGGSEGHHLVIPPLLRGNSEFTVDSSLTGASGPDGIAAATGAAAGATALHAPEGFLGVPQHDPSPSPLASPGLDSVLRMPGTPGMHLDPTDTAYGADPAASTASITAIRAGQEGHMPLVHARPRVDPSRTPSSLTTSSLQTPATVGSTPLAQPPLTAAAIEDLDGTENHVSPEGSETKVSEMTQRTAPEVQKSETEVEPGTERRVQGLGIEHASLDRGATVTSDERSLIGGGATLAAAGAGAGLAGATAMHASSLSRSPASLSPANRSPATHSPKHSPANGSAASSIPSSSPPLGSPREGDKPLPASTPRAKSRRVPVPKMDYIAPVESLSPGNVEQAVGHPATRGVAGAAREPATYPPPKWDGPAEHEHIHHKHLLHNKSPAMQEDVALPREEKALPVPQGEKDLPVPQDTRGEPESARDAAQTRDVPEQMATATRHPQTAAHPEQLATTTRQHYSEQIPPTGQHPASPQPEAMEEMIHTAGPQDHEQLESPQSPSDNSPRRRHSLSGSRRAAGNLVGSLFRTDGSRPKTEVQTDTDEEPWRPEPGYQGVSGLGIENRPVRSRSRSGSMFGAAKAVVSSAGSAITNGVRNVSSPSSSRANASANPMSPGSPTVSHHHSTFSTDASDPPSPTAARPHTDDMRDARDPQTSQTHSRNVSSSSSRRKMGGMGMGGSSIFTKLKSDMKALGAEAKAKTSKTKLRK